MKHWEILRGIMNKKLLFRTKIKSGGINTTIDMIFPPLISFTPFNSN